jgi:hypothetical protein
VGWGVVIVVVLVLRLLLFKLELHRLNDSAFVLRSGGSMLM